MVRGNWQKRVETAEARRKEAKQRKHRSEEKRIFKSMAQGLLSLLDRNMDTIRRRSSSAGSDHTSTCWNLHIWTDTMPSNSPPFLDIIVDADDGGGTKGGRRTRSLSIEESFAATKGGKKGKGRARSGSFQQDAGGGKNTSSKKVHPRSKEADAVPVDENKPMAPLLCRSHFFYEKCADLLKSGKKGGCRCVHYNNKKYKTLGAVLSSGGSKSNNNNQQQNTLIENIEGACIENTDQNIADATPGSMEMVYYLTIPVPTNVGESDVKNDMTEEETPNHAAPTISELITDDLTSNSCSVASIVYVVLSTPSKNVLLYDRNQEGLLFSDFSSHVLGSNNSEGDSNDKMSAGTFQAQHLPVSILEHILAYLEAPAVASATQVCTAWHREIGHASPNLWKHLLNQRSWPVPAHMGVLDMDLDTSSTSNNTLQESPASEGLSKCLRDEFVKHYSVLRDMRAIQLALTGLLTKKSCLEKEMTFQAFSTRRGAPQAPNNCVGVEVWGKNQVLAAYSNDCTLRLFQAVPSGKNNNQHEKYCRELVCQSIDPYKNTKKKICYMEAMGLDEDVIGCLCSVSDETSDFKSPHVLVILSREDLLVVDFSTDTAGRISEPEEGALHVIDVEEAVLNYILSLDHVDHRLLRLHDFLALGGDSEEVEFIVSQSMAACGYGRFMVEVAISIPFPDDEENDNDGVGDMNLLDRKLFLFSSSVGAIVWMGDSNPPNDLLRPRLEDMTLACLRRALPGGGNHHSSCSVASISNAYAPSIMSCEIDHSGTIDGNHALGSSEWTQTERVVEEGWNVRIDGRKPIVVTPTTVVVGDTLTRHLQEGSMERQYKSIITFYSRFPTIDAHDAIGKLSFGENCIIDRLVGFRDDYVIVICRFFTETGFVAVDGGGGHWGNEMDRVARVYAVTLHVSTRSEIERLCLYEDFGFNKLSLAVCGDTVACGVWLQGMIMTGNDVRSVGNMTNNSAVFVLDDTVTSSKASRKKNKKRRSKGSGKKDGFARGMSLRG